MIIVMIMMIITVMNRILYELIDKCVWKSGLTSSKIWFQRIWFGNPPELRSRGRQLNDKLGKWRKELLQRFERDDITREPLGGGGWPTLGRVCCNRGEGGEQGEQSEQEWVAHREMKQFKPLLQTWEGEREILPHTTQCTGVVLVLVVWVARAYSTK